MKNMAERTSKEYWEQFWEKNQDKSETKVLTNSQEMFALEIFSKYLPKSKEMKFIEIGCVPGEFLIDFHQNFDYQVAGIDLCDLKETENNLQHAGIKNYSLMQTNLDTFKTTEKYDIIGAFGFIEHFDQPEIQIKKMSELVGENGYLLLDIPNFRYLQYYLHKFLDRKDVFVAHNLKTMDLNVIREITEKNGWQTLFLSYYKPFNYWHNHKNWLMKIINLPILALGFISNKIFTALHLNSTLICKYTSPHIVYIGKKKSVDKSEQQTK